MYVPTRAIPFIEMQRSHFKENEDLRQFFSRDIKEEFHDISSMIPILCKQIVDIGCGLGGIDYLLYTYYKTAMFTLIDKEGISKNLHYGFKQTASYYNLFEITKDFLSGNQVNLKDFTFLDASKVHEIIKDSVDLVISLYSWGYYYPIGEYIDVVYHMLKMEGLVILDIRTGQGQLEDLATDVRFEIVKVRTLFNKRHRTLLRKVK